MGQKININSLRVGKRQNWKSDWFENKNYSKTFFKDDEIRKVLKKIINFFGYSLNNFYIKKTNKKFHIINKLIFTSKLLFFVKNLKLKKPSSYKSLILKKVKNKNVSKITPFLSDIFLDLQKYDSKIKNTIFYSQKYTTLPFISSQCLTNYLALQLICSEKLKDNCFKKNYWQGLTLFLYSFFNKTTISKINGIKLLCSGRWKKSKTGRKQKFICFIGKLKNQSYSTFIDYSFTNVNTKYGTCCIKIWISYRFS